MLSWRMVFPLAGAVLLSGSCVYDADDPCGENQRLEDKVCVCEEGFGLVDGHCVACGDDEVGNPIGPCACAEGLTRLGADEPCTDALGHACESDEDCGGDYGYCHVEEGGGYCTARDCEPGEDDCPGVFACNDREEVAFCEGPPEGFGKSCDDSSDCEGQEAGFCESLSEQICVVGGCADDPSVCHGDWVCCDISLIMTSLCVPPSEVEDGACPAGGTLVER